MEQKKEENKEEEISYYREAQVNTKQEYFDSEIMKKE